jgi:hypothetical protein
VGHANGVHECLVAIVHLLVIHREVPIRLMLGSLEHISVGVIVLVCHHQVLPRLNSLLILGRIVLVIDWPRLKLWNS